MAFEHDTYYINIVQLSLYNNTLYCNIDYVRVLNNYTHRYIRTYMVHTYA